MTGGPVTRDMLRGAISELALEGSPIAVHVSLRSFPRVAGGPEALVGAFLDLGCTLLVPTMANTLFGIPAPPDDRPVRNGRDHRTEDARARPIE